MLVKISIKTDPINVVPAACYTLAVAGRKLANAHIRLAKTTYSLGDCEELCSRESRYCAVLCSAVLANTSFACLGFSYRQPQSAGEVYNCDLTASSGLDQYSSYDLLPDSLYDFYQRSYTGADCGQSGSQVNSLSAKNEYDSIGIELTL